MHAAIGIELQVDFLFFFWLTGFLSPVLSDLLKFVSCNLLHGIPTRRSFSLVNRANFFFFHQNLVLVRY